MSPSQDNDNQAESQLVAADPRDPSDMVAYAQGAIVSREILKNSAGTLTLFAFDSGQSLSEHQVPFDAVVQVLDGQVELTIGGRAIIAEAGQLVLMPANVPHAVRATQRFKMLLTMLKAGSSQ